jgi:hypothetical protein
MESAVGLEERLRSVAARAVTDRTVPSLSTSDPGGPEVSSVDHLSDGFLTLLVFGDALN